VKRSLVAAAAIGIVFIAPATALADRPSCSATSTSPVLVSNNVPYEESPIAAAAGVNGTANVRVDLDNQGIVLGAYLVRSTGSLLLDGQALTIARSMQFAAQRQACPNIAGSYSVLIGFNDDRI
jgi:TonB family protein